MKKILLQFFVSLVLMSLTLAFANSIAFAAPTPTATEPTSILDQAMGQTGLGTFEGRLHKLSSVEPGADIITSAIFYVIDFMKYLIGAIAVIYVIVTGIKLIVAGNKIDEVSEKQKDSIKYIIYGLILIIIADELVTKVFFGEYGECVSSVSNAAECAKVGGGLVKGLYDLILSVIATVAVFMLSLSAFKLITAYGNEETIGKQKKHIGVALVGLVLAGVGEFVVKKIIFPDGGSQFMDVAAAQKLVFNFTNFVSAFIGVSAFGMFLYGGYLYISSFGNEEGTGKAKKIIFGAVIGILIAFAAFGLISTLSTYTSGREIALPGSLPGAPGRPNP